MISIRKAKRLRLRDYREEGFFFEAEFPEGAFSPGDAEKAVDSFLEFLEANGLRTAMSYGAPGRTPGPWKWKGIIHHAAKYRRTTEEEKASVREKLASLGAQRGTPMTSPNADLWHDRKNWEKLETPSETWAAGPEKAPARTP